MSDHAGGQPLASEPSAVSAIGALAATSPVPVPVPATARLRIRLGDDELVVEPGEVAVIGRHRTVTLRTADERVSRFHAVVRHTDRGWTFHDTGSLNGSYLAGELVAEQHVGSAMTLRLGHRTLGAALELIPEP